MEKTNSQLVQDLATIHRRIINIVWMTINYIHIANYTMLSFCSLYHVLTVRTHLGVAWKWWGTCWFTDQSRDCFNDLLLGAWFLQTTCSRPCFIFLQQSMSKHGDDFLPQAFLVQNPVDASVWMPGMMGWRHFHADWTPFKVCCAFFLKRSMGYNKTTIKHMWR